MCVSSTNKVEIKGDDHNITGIIYAPNARIIFDAEEESYVYGALIGKDVRVSGEATVRSNPELHLWAPNALHILTWEVE